MTLTGILVFAVLGLLLFNSITSAFSLEKSNRTSIIDDWTIYRHDPQHTGNATSTASNPNLLWQFNTGDKIR